MKEDRETHAEELKPRERLWRDGVDSLHLGELIGIIFNTGYRAGNVREHAWELGARLLTEYGTCAVRDIRDVNVMQEATGLPPVKSAQLVACMEIGRRLFGNRHLHVSQRAIHSPEDVVERLSDMCALKKEQLRGLYLNARNYVVHEETISIGTITANLVSPADVFRPALQYNAVGVIVVHNHPSGDPTPSDEDVAITSQLTQAGTMLGISVLDHIIVAKDDHTSLRDVGVM